MIECVPNQIREGLWLANYVSNMIRYQKVILTAKTIKNTLINSDEWKAMPDFEVWYCQSKCKCFALYQNNVQPMKRNHSDAKTCQNFSFMLMLNYLLNKVI